MKGLEPSTSGTTNQRSNQLSYTHHNAAGRSLGLAGRRQLVHSRRSVNDVRREAHPSSAAPTQSDGAMGALAAPLHKELAQSPASCRRVQCLPRARVAHPCQKTR